MSGVDYFDDRAAINPFMDASVTINRQQAAAEHTAIRAALENTGVNVVQVPPPAGCQDGVYTANWALVRGNTAVLANLPNVRKDEEKYAQKVLQTLGKQVVRVPDDLKFSGQGDALPCGNYLFAGSGYRTDAAVHPFLAQTLGYQVITLQTIPLYDTQGLPAKNAVSGWADSFFYDIDLALTVLRDPTDTQKGLIAWCPEAFLPDSQRVLLSFTAVDKIEVSLDEAKTAFACNAVSTGNTIVMSAHAPQFCKQLVKYGFSIVSPHISELAKGGGYIRCTTLTLDNSL